MPPLSTLPFSSRTPDTAAISSVRSLISASMAPLEYISKISGRITLFGALCLAVLATLPTFFYRLVGLNLPLAASSLLIAVSVAIETARQLQAQMEMRHYKGFLK